MPVADAVEVSGAEALVAALAGNGVDTIFGLPGVQLDPVFDALHGTRDTIRVLHTRHEQATAYMAFGYAQVTGRVGTSLVVPGPGALNTMAALSTAYACNAPVLLVTSQIPSPFIEGGLGFLHEIPDQLGALASVTKWQRRANSVADVPEVVNEAFRQLASGRRRPVAIELPPDIAARRGSATFDPPLSPDPVPAPDPDDAARAADLLAGARSPAIFVGGGALDAGEEVLTIAEMLQAPVIMSEHGMGTVDIRHPLAQTLQVGNDIWPAVDVVLAVGTRLFHPIAEWGRDSGPKLVRIDIDPAQSVAHWPPDVHLVTSAGEGVSAIGRALAAYAFERADRTDEYRRLKAAKHAELAALLAPQEAFTQAIRSEVREDGIVCFDVCQLHFYSWFGYPVYRPRTIIQPGYQGTLGYGYPTALGAKVGAPERPVVYIGGDGGFMFNVQEMSTAMRFGINVVAIVFNDNAFGNVQRAQREMFGGRLIASDLYNPDFGKLADSFGMRFYRTETPQGLRKNLRAAIDADEPALIEVAFGGFPNPFPHMFFRKVRG